MVTGSPTPNSNKKSGNNAVWGMLRKKSSKGEIKVYLALLKTGVTPIGQLVDETGLQKSTVYFCLNQLISKGLAGHVTKNNRKVFEAGSPERLLDYLEKKQKRITEQKQKVEELIPFLYGKMNSPQKREQAKIFEGWNGMKTAFDELLLSDKSEDLVTFAVNPIPSVVERFRRFIQKMHQKRTARNIPTRILMNEEFLDSIGKDREKERRTQVRYVSKEFSSPAAINVYGNIVLVALWVENPTAFVIENAEVANSFRSYFDLLWKSAKA